MIRDLVETTLARQKDLDHHWEDQVDVSHFLACLIFANTHSLPEPLSGVPYPLRIPALQIYPSFGCPFSTVIQFGHDK